MRLDTESYATQSARWPKTGRAVLAHFDAESVVVYQAYRPAIGRYAAEHGHFGGEFSFERMSWIKPSFLWMMYRCGWGTKDDQQTVLAVRLRRAGFDAILAQAATAGHGDVRLQWDPDHDPGGNKVERRAIQLGLRGETLAKYGREWIEDIEDVSDFVAAQWPHVRERGWGGLVTPREEVYPIGDPEVARRLGVTGA